MPSAFAELTTALPERFTRPPEAKEFVFAPSAPAPSSSPEFASLSAGERRQVQGAEEATAKAEREYQQQQHMATVLL